MAKRRREIQLKFRVTPEEQALIHQKMEQYGTENMAAYLRKMAIDGYVVRLDLPELRELVSQCLARVHGEGLLDRRMGALSGGELQRVLLALALEPLPHILILDEPLSGVDVDGERQLLDMLDEIRTRFDLSILLSTHDFATLDQYADKVILLKSQVLKVGPPDEVLSSPEFQEVFHLALGKGGRK